MGLLRKGDIMSWTDLWKTREILKNRGIDQFIKAYTKNKDNVTSLKAFGEELELILVIKDKDTYKLYCQGEIITDHLSSTSVEYARYMVEISSIKPYTRLRNMEEEIIKRVEEIERYINKSIIEDNTNDKSKRDDNTNIKDINEDIISILMLPCFPHMHYPMFYDTKPLTSDLTLSLNFPDNAITQHKRFESLTENIRNRRGRKPEGRIKIMDNINSENIMNNNNHILIDSVGQGMGCCGLQVTIQGSTIQEARFIYDMAGILGPLLLRLSRGTPTCSGKLLQTETRWEMLEMSVDCRRDQERGAECVYSNSYSKNPNSSEIPKSRCSSFDLFISTDRRNLNSYNDTNPPIHRDIYKKLIKGGVDEKLAKHVASLFIRDPFVSYLSTNEETYDDFENIQSSNWRSVRFKLPSENIEEELSGWKVEVRPMEMQATPFENTALVYFTYLLIQAILEYNLNLYIPISKVDKNFIRSNIFTKSINNLKEEDTQKFYYRFNIKEDGEPVVKEGTLDKIFLGEEGLLKYVYKIIDEKYSEDKSYIIKYIKFIEDKINNKYLCLSDWIRQYIISHPDYKGDSSVSEEILQDLIRKLIEIRKENSVEYLRNK